MAKYAGMRFLEIWYSRIDIDDVSRLFDAVQPKKAVRRRHRDIEKAHKRTSLAAMTKFAQCVRAHGQSKFPDPPYENGELNSLGFR